MVSGRLLGGTSKINNMLYTRQVPGEFSAWTEAGRKGWTWDDVEPYYNKSETTLSHTKSEHRGHKGPWFNRRLDDIPMQNISETIAATSSFGIPYVTESNDPSAPAVCCARLDHTIDDQGRRCSAFDAFLPPHVALRSNLDICTEIVVTSVDLEETPNGLRAVGVFFEHDSIIRGKTHRRYHCSAKREVILSSGAIGTPKILMLSGVGPAEHLKSLNIPVKKDLPGVGANLQDHLGVPVIFKAPKHDTFEKLLSNPFSILWELIKYLLFATGLMLCPLPQISIFALSRLLDDDSNTVVHSANGKAEFDAHISSNVPDIELMALSINASDEQFVELKDWYTGAFSYLCVALRPESHGTLRLRSVDPRDFPVCDLAFLTKPNDYVVMRKAVKLGLALGRRLREQGYPLRDLQVPDSESDEDLDKFIRAGSRTTFHYSSTCRMAPEAELGAVDDQLRVHGIQGLRIADASIFSSIPATHLQAPVVMVAERCADFIKASY
ncbi:unnamed protein product [Somion occarium]|uniref:Glucose-methanol-choline oxidoreductase N-terminal domain-containing protein n=2 Tax=Somion occarium TaxID=3059160 RepID=A0ABP1D423_9APHY